MAGANPAGAGRSSLLAGAGQVCAEPRPARDGHDARTGQASGGEHLASRCTPGPTWSEFVSGFGLRGEERARHLAARRRLALFWLVLLLPGAPALVRNPEGTLEQQAERVLTLLA